MHANQITVSSEILLVSKRLQWLKLLVHDASTSKTKSFIARYGQNEQYIDNNIMEEIQKSTDWIIRGVGFIPFLNSD